MEERFGLKALSTGEMLRTAVEERTEIGVRVEERMASGDLVPDDLIVAMVAERIEEPDCAAGVVLDGFPRTLPQARVFGRYLAERGMALALVILFEADDAAMVERISGRFSCARCGEGYHDVNKPPRREGVCDVCGERRFRRRADDNPETVRHRLEDYHALTEPLLRYFREKGILETVDAMTGIGRIAHDIESLMEAALTG